MLAFIKVPFIFIVFILLCLAGFIGCLFRPFHPLAIYWIAQTFSKVSYLLGVRLIQRGQEHIDPEQSYVVIANHQSTYDIFTLSGAVFPRVTSIGKKALLYYPFFGLMYWLSGNILIDRKNGRKASDTLEVAAEQIKQKRRSVWMFPEGTRSRGRGMLQFKLGAFRLAAKAQVPILPVVASNVYQKIDNNKLNNGVIILQTLPPVIIDDSKSLKEWADHFRDLMMNEFERLNKEVAEIEATERNDEKISN